MNQEEKVRAIKNAYQRDWRKKNRDRVRVYNETYWKRKFEKGEKHESEN